MNGSIPPDLKRRTKRLMGRMHQRVWPSADRPGMRGLAYHSIVRHAGQDPQQMTTPLDLFEEQMVFLASHGYHVERAVVVVERLRRGEPLPPRTIVLTFDDGFTDAYHLILPVLDRYQFPATCFVMPVALDGEHRTLSDGWEGAYLTWEQARALKASGLVDIGCHGATHRNLRGLPPEVLAEEIDEAKRWLERGLDCAVSLFAYPFGSYGAWDEHVRSAVDRAGFVGAFTSIAGLNTSASDPLLLRRCRVSWCDEIPEFARLLDGAYDWYATVQRWQAGVLT